MHRRAARLLTAALGAALLVAPASAGAYTITGQPSPEGDEVVFTVTKANIAETVPSTATPIGVTAMPGVDFDDSNRPVAAVGMQTEIKVPTIEDGLGEDDETLKLKIGNVESQPVAITDDDPVVLSIADLAVAEPDGPAATLTISASNPSESDLTIPLSGVNGTAFAPGDYAVPANVTLPAGEKSVAFPSGVLNDDFDETDETFTVVLGAPAAGATIGDGEGVVTIGNDDVRILDVFDAGTLEGDGGTSIAQFIVRLNGPTFRAVSFRYTTADGLARAPVDYLGRLGTARIAPGETSTTVDVPVVGDNLPEPAEAFALTLSEVENARAGDLTAVGVISDDDGDALGVPPSVDPEDTMPPRMSLSRPKAKGRKVTLRVTCPRGERSCSGRVTIFTVADRRAKVRSLRSERRLGVKSFKLGGGRARTLAITVPASVARAARRAGRLKVQAFAVTQDVAGNVDTRTARATLRYGKRKSR